jgi:predicted RNA-binding Zn ribbon-like protein
VPNPDPRTTSAAGPLPAQLSVVAGFLNTASIDGQPDHLVSAAEVSRWLVRQRLVPPGTQFDQRDAQRLHEVRETLRQLASANAGSAIDLRAVTTLNEAVRRIRLGIRLHPADGYRLIAEGTGIDRPIGELLLRVMTAMNSGSWQRLKVCANPDCGRVFYDSSRNRSARWHSMETCGNRMKGRAYRRRRSSASGQQERAA